jgi:PelA/Pel-15E family pectate lyase
MTVTFRAGLLILALAPPVPAAILGTNTPAQPLTLDRVAAEPPAWREYLKRSSRQLQADQAFFHDEMKAHGIKVSSLPPAAHGAGSIPMNQPTAWYGSADARRIADIIVSFQTPAGGWSKNLNMSIHVRAPGEHFAPDNSSQFLGAGDYDAPHDSHWSYVGTFDNDATITQLRYLAKVIAAIGSQHASSYRAAFLHGLDYVFSAQYPNGGWPQVWPLQGGYHDSITFNDGAMVHILELLQDVAEIRADYTFVPDPIRSQAGKSLEQGIGCILTTQIVVKGRRTVWCQQHDPLTLQPTSARNYEMPSLCAAESADVLMFLMRLPNPSPSVVAAVHAAASWFEKSALHDIAFKTTGQDGRHAVAEPGAGPTWARYYEIGTDRPIFGDRDKTIHDTVDEISRERRAGYTWYRDTAKRALQQYANWSQEHPLR